LLSLLSIIYQGIETLYFSFALFNVSASISNKYLGLGFTSIKNVPFGPL